jgi:glycerol-3-phosphate dehydrogenase (NAD(P)+)
MRVGVVGLGAWGSALSLHLARQGNEVVAWSRSNDGTSVLRVGAVEYPLPENVTRTTDTESLTQCSLSILALPARAWGDVASRIHSPIVVSATKGIEPDTSLAPLAYLTTTLKRTDDSVCVLSGPSFASDLAAGRPISVVAASSNAETAGAVASTIAGTSMRVYTSTDVIGVEYGGILKNIIAIAAGVSDSLGIGPSGRAGLITRGLSEMTRLAVSLGADARTLSGLSGLGDLIMTATEDQSRNRTVGLRLGRGENLEEIVKTLGSTAEGVASTKLALTLARSKNVSVPITEQVADLLDGKATPHELVAKLMMRPRTSEY